MDPKIMKEVLELKLHNRYPEGSTSRDRFVIRRRADTFRIKDGDLYYICRRKQNKAEHLAKVVSTAEEASNLFVEFHASDLGGHCGVEKTHSAIIARYYWPGMEDDIRKWIAQCPQCQARRATIKEKREYNPIETNGLVERLNGTIQRSLNKLVAEHPNRWDQYLQPTMFALRTKKQLTTQYSPYYLMFGREARYPSEVPDEYDVTEEKVCSLIKTEEICQGLRDQVPVYNEVKANIEAKQQKVRKRKEDRGQADHFKVGDLVLKKNARQAMRKGDKLEASLVGPYKILKLEEKTAHLVSERGTQSKVNIDHLTHYFQPEERIPAKIRKLIDPTPLAGSNESSHTSVTPPARQPTSCEAQGPPLSADILIRDVWAGRRRTTLWSRLGPYKLYLEDLLYLAPGKELESQLALDRDVAAGAVCHEGHWTLIIMYLKEMRSLYLDPFGATQQQIERCKHVTRALVRQKCPAIGRWACATLAHPRQQDTTSCGVFVCKLAEQILLAQQIDYAVDQEGVAMLRMEMAKALLANTDDLSQLCRACGEESSGAEMDEWRSLEQLREHGNTDDHS
ncbi:hypothetical protein ABVT39_012776 [Epinephelus coioides]